MSNAEIYVITETYAGTEETVKRFCGDDALARAESFFDRNYTIDDRILLQPHVYLELPDGTLSTEY